LGKGGVRALGLLTLLAGLGGCSGLLPHSQQISESPWNSFSSAKAAYEKVVPGKTTVKDLKGLGFSPYDTPNIRILTYLDVIDLFVPRNAITLDDLDPAVRSCIAAKSRCLAYEAMPARVNDRRTGNVLADMLSFRRNSIKTGWTFRALFVIDDGMVVYKLWGGRPAIREISESKNPLGPLQTTESIPNAAASWIIH